MTLRDPSSAERDVSFLEDELLKIEESYKVSVLCISSICDSDHCMLVLRGGRVLVVHRRQSKTDPTMDGQCLTVFPLAFGTAAFHVSFVEVSYKHDEAVLRITIRCAVHPRLGEYVSDITN